MGSPVVGKVTAVQDRLSLTAAEVRSMLKIDAGECGDLISLAIDAAKAAADEYMNNPFWEIAETTYDSAFNWSGNRVRSSLESAGGEGDLDIIRNDSTQYETRLNHSVPDLWTYPRVELDIPAPVKLGVVKYVELVLNAAPEGVAEERIGDWQIKYLNFVSNTDRAAFIKQTYWQQYRMLVGM